MGRLTTHVLDTMAGTPAAGLAIEPWTVGEDDRRLEPAIAKPALARLSPTAKWREDARRLEMAIASPDGRTDAPPLEGGALAAERCESCFRLGESCFRAGEYLCTRGIDPDPRLLDEILIRLGVADFDLPCHLPLPISACGCSACRGG